MTTLPGSSHFHGAPRGCGRDNCDLTQIEEVDVLCRTHGALLVLSRIPPRSRYILGFIVFVLAAVAFFIAPMLDSSLPVFLVLGGAGLALLGLPLRMFPVAGRSIVAGWVVACPLAFVFNRPFDGASQLVLTVITLAVTLGWVLRLGRSAIETNKLADSAGGVFGAALIATCLGVAGLAGMLWLATARSGDDTNARLPQALSTPLAWIGWLTVIFVAVALSGFAAVRSTARWSDRESWLIESRAAKEICLVEQPRPVRRVGEESTA